MLDLSTQPPLPRYEVKLADGTVKSYDAVLLSYNLRDLEGEENPAKILEFVNKTFELNVDALTALQILDDFTEFSTKHLEEPLKKVFGRVLSSTTTTGSPPENSENSSPPSS